MNCSSCQSEATLHNTLCLTCLGKRYDRLKSACEHLVANWRDYSSLDAAYGNVDPEGVKKVKERMSHYANRLDEVVKKCTT